MDAETLAQIRDVLLWLGAVTQIAQNWGAFVLGYRLTRNLHL